MFLHVEPELDATKYQELIKQFELLREDAVGAQQILGGRAKCTEATIPYHTMGPDKPLGTRTRNVPLADQPAPAFMPMLNVNPTDPLAPVPSLSEDLFQHQTLALSPLPQQSSPIFPVPFTPP